MVKLNTCARMHSPLPWPRFIKIEYTHILNQDPNLFVTPTVGFHGYTSSPMEAPLDTEPH